ncbi:hypothetical protein AB1Y20_022272 [Prymnesium parvum]|uniref:Protein RFT1 homolog n=1 Tax=Prymnesium parvum TaxID=97485 RepID=A0AB34JIC2_PRYPA
MSLSAASSLLGLSFFSRVLTFGMNTALARGLGPQWYGLACVQLQLLTSTALFLAQEGIRRACQRIYPGGDEPALLTHTVNLAWMSVPITLFTALALGWYSTTHTHEEDASALVPRDERSLAVWMVCSAAVVEACAEPGWVYAQQNMRTPMRVAAEGSALVVRVLATYFLTLVRQHGAIGFGVAQLAYAVVYVTLLYAMLFRSRAPRLWPRRAPPSGDSRWLSPRGRTLGLQYSAQSIQKYVLTEGERVVLIAVSPLAQQGAFALVSNLGSLVARLLLAPMEEVAFASFSRRAAAGSLDRVAFLQLYAMLRAAAIFGGVFVSFGPSYSWLLLHILYGDKWSTTEAPSALAMYCWLVCAMGLNGISEAFVNATAKDEQLRRLWCVAAPLLRTVLPLVLSCTSRIRTLPRPSIALHLVELTEIFPGLQVGDGCSFPHVYPVGCLCTLALRLSRTGAGQCG